jgi:hypothetical protein
MIRVKLLGVTFAATALAMAPIAAVPALAVKADNQTGAQSSEPRIEPSVMAFNQKADGKMVNIHYLNLPQNGYIAIHAASDGKPGKEVLCYVPLNAGSHMNIKVELSKPVESGMTLWASLYRDDDSDQKLDKSKDAPFWPDGEPKENKFEIL